ncbi:hypothetical protein HER10_EVM0002882 [Colletotrichum scovillei]|uniref:Uncharacterized protein n=4 Tax=Colletotrichum acutatum species complex TaxID=2707335 RepID=A0A135UAU9_9PEZI|nr:uncharacterized protein HER10_EVM0002882 [Colletotrichum scovillei]XP_053051840.1 uncharacterized protein COL516b_003926 [Colletotrichum fioriniae]XP_060360079.1 uncharacterized protein BDZ83DRAFT_756477 [Colletotrichum acutatum]EXF82163.1 hypothetical protein CFIO01_00677 [Colletotrichum fioriniae PJ7]KXH57520.1 hypothetical protein CSAL01_08753 [Colletotrichum salicis]KAF4776024.1 hypothetical protein HER10_EVM0002882 [Colletotrichum scovillei]KAG7047227.1 hypothetical protein JMJ77_0010
MKTTIATLVLFVTMGLSAKTTSLCRDVGNKVIEDNGVCSTAGGAPLGKGICCFDQSNALVKSRFDIACDDKLGTVQSTGEACEA